MFEKEAEEYTNNLLKDVNCNIGNPRARQINSIDVEEAYQNGAEFGYNKGKNEAIKHLKDLIYVVELGKNELATARILAEAKEFLRETK